MTFFEYSNLNKSTNQQLEKKTFPNAVTGQKWNTVWRKNMGMAQKETIQKTAGEIRKNGMS